MKKILISLLFAALIIPAFLKSDLYAGDLSVGATAWYTNWDMGDPTYKPDPGIMYGPVASYKINDSYNLTFLFLYGNFSNNIDLGLGSSLQMDISRYDSDIAINKKIGDYFKIFAGAKVMGYNYSFSFSGGTMEMNELGVGPGAGISALLPIGGDLFLLGNLSAMYLWASYDNGTTTGSGKQYGINSSAALAYYIKSASTTLSLGARYQTYKDNPDDAGGTTSTKSFYGVTLSAIYTFSSSAE